VIVPTSNRRTDAWALRVSAQRTQSVLEINGVSVIDSGNGSVHRSAPGNAGRQGRNKPLNPCASTTGKPHNPLDVLKSRRRQT
jgi:hypothetical protein